MKKVLLVAVFLVLAPVCAIGQGFYGTESLTVPEMTGPTTLDGVLDGKDSWNSAFSPMWLSDCFDDEGIPGDASDISAQFSMGTYKGDLYIAVVVTDDIDNTNGGTWQRDGLEVHVNFENVLVNMSEGSGVGAAENRKINFLENGAAQIRVIGGANAAITPWPAGYPNAECQAVLDFARRRSGTTTTYEVVIKVSDMPDVSITGPFGFGISVNDVDETDDSRIAAVAWWGGPQQAQGLYNIVIVTGSSTIRPWQYTMNHASPTDLSYPQCTAFLAIPGLASNPNPADGQTDVLRDTILGWTSGESAVKHNVYFGTDWADVKDATTPVSSGQDDNTFDPGRLAFGQTYYWRVDEVNSAPDFTVFKGNVWSFTVEPVAYPIVGENIIAATASSSNSPGEGPENTINGSGLDTDDLHSAINTDMWLSSTIGTQPTWIQYEFDRIYKLHEMLVWNHNSLLELAIGFGVRDVTIEYSTDGANWATLGASHEFARAPGAAGYAPNTTVDLSGVAAKYIKITTNSNWGGFMPQFGLSEVRFFYVPVLAREPNPASGTTDMAVDNVTLSWRAGREAASHDVQLSDSNQAVIDGTALVATVSETSYDTGELQLNQSYYWKVNEVNEAEAPATWEGDVLNFMTREFLVVDDFEDYTNFSPDRVFQRWIDGVGYSADEFFPVDNPGNGTGAALGHDIWSYDSPHYDGDIMERSIVHGGTHSAPLYYDNSIAPFASEIVRTFDAAQDWTKHGIKALTLYFYGAPDNGGQLYVKINDTKISDNADLSMPRWNQMNIDLTGLTVDNVTSITVGVDGAGAVGVLLVDNIRLYVDAPAIPEYIWIEAETGVITGTNYEVTTMDGASGGQALSPLTAGSLSDANDNKASYTVQSTGGTYTLEGRFNALDGYANSCFVRIPGIQDDFVTWHTPYGGVWKWGILVEFEMPAGTYTLEISPREFGCNIDAIVFTKVSE